MMTHLAAQPLPEKVADLLRDRLIAGDFAPGQKLSEQSLSDSLGVSRNTLREAFRLLTSEGLLSHQANRGVFVMTPSIAAVIDIYRVRRVIECGALVGAYVGHPAVARMQDAVKAARAANARKNWQALGSANMSFHAAIVALADSERLSSFYARIAAELRLSFALLDNPERLHAPYVDMNADILQKLIDEQPYLAAQTLNDYLTQSERAVVAALAHVASDGGSSY